MKAERQQKESQKAEPIQSKRERTNSSFVDNRPQMTSQAKLLQAIPKKEKNLLNVAQRKIILDPRIHRFRVKKEWIKDFTNMISSSPLVLDPNQLLIAPFDEEDYLGLTQYLVAKDKTVSSNSIDENDFNLLDDADIPNIDQRSIIRFVIYLNLSAHATKEDLLATLLHEWNVHITDYSQMLLEIRTGRRDTLSPISADSQHSTYGQLGDDILSNWVRRLPLDIQAGVLAKVKEDRNRYKSYILQ